MSEPTMRWYRCHSFTFSIGSCVRYKILVGVGRLMRGSTQLYTDGTQCCTIARGSTRVVLDGTLWYASGARQYASGTRVVREWYSGGTRWVRGWYSMVRYGARWVRDGTWRYAVVHGGYACSTRVVRSGT